MGEELISRTGAGYRLTLATDQSDLLTFTDLATKAAAHHVAGEPEEAERAYRKALALWRGAGAGRPRSAALHHPVVVAVSQRRLTTVLDYADLALDRGHHEAALTRLREVATPNPCTRA